MNEINYELAKQAGLYHKTTVITSAVPLDQMLEKFAELIVRECADTCLRMQLGNQYTPEEMLFQTKYRNLIKKHFGVEE